jgi:predicted small secreted protein
MNYQHFTELRTMKTFFAIALTTIILTGCNTIAGIGKDVQKVGQVVEGAGRK